ncbi:DUF2442 domain-containing protein [Rhodopirellula sallentina]|uniref:DUF2442 domain-containing protein n=1 Tax=Rhodopirellula sallentina SM41 TaxID=1263870 RepID=M5UA17_9BACT|nr:DUF2442 domain-containing protein [Rhodopirellula sallentina]EMI58267.1 hypothetical protein RSSM_00291 [Rhodopirellula sallentina SM41]
MILHILNAELAGPTSLSVRFSDGCDATVDLLPLLSGPMFEPLLNPTVFAQFTLDPVCKTICWPNGADLAPEAIRSLVPTGQEIGG